MEIDHDHDIPICRIDGEWSTFDDREVHHMSNGMDKVIMLFERTAIVFSELMEPGEM
jgi:hypothetical protein